MRHLLKKISFLVLASSLAAASPPASAATIVPVGSDAHRDRSTLRERGEAERTSPAPAKSNIEKAREIFETLLDKTPDDPDVYRYLGEIYIMQRQYKKAEEFFDRYAEMQPSDYRPYYRLGDMFWSMDRRGKAKEEYEKALGLLGEMEEPDLEARTARARMLGMTGEKEESDREFRELERANPDDTGIASAHIATLIDMDRLRAAESAAEEQAALHPDDYEILRSLARVKMLRYKYGEAHEAMAALRDEFVEDEDIRSDYAYLLYNEQDWVRAMPLYKELSEQYPKDRDYAEIYDELFRRYRPAIRGGFSYRITGGDRFGPYLRYVHPIDSDWTFESGYEFNYNTSDDVPGDPGYSVITNDIPLLARYSPHPTLKLGFGISNQFVGQSYFPAGLFFLDWERNPYGRLALFGEYNGVLDDPTSAFAYDGTQDDAALAYENIFYRRVVFNALYASTWYRVDSSKTPQDLGDDYGRRDAAEAGLQYIFLHRPEIRMGYDFRYEKLHVANDYLDIIPLIEESQRHLITFAYYHELNKWINIDAYGFVGADPKRDLGFGDLYGIALYNRFKPSRRLEILAGYEYSNESLTDTTGRYHFINVEVLYRF